MQLYIMTYESLTFVCLYAYISLGKCNNSQLQRFRNKDLLLLLLFFLFFFVFLEWIVVEEEVGFEPRTCEIPQRMSLPQSYHLLQ